VPGCSARTGASLRWYRWASPIRVISMTIRSRVFDIQLEDSAVAKAIDGRFRSGPLAGKTVNIKIYGKREGLLDTNSDHTLDYFLVLCGPKASTLTSKGGT
jgi:hypothetical protein